jgi:hypothetical protein
MPFSSWQRYLYRVVAGSVLLIWGIVEILLYPSGDSILPTALLAAGLAFLITGVSRRRKFGEGPEQDERSRRIGAWGMSYSWYLSLAIMWFLFLLDHFGLVTFTAEAALGVALIVMTLSAVIFQVFLSRKGDVE